MREGVHARSRLGIEEACLLASWSRFGALRCVLLDTSVTADGIE